MGFVSLAVTIVCFTLLIIAGKVTGKECNKSHDVALWIAAVLGCLIGAFGIGHLIAEYHGGKPIATFANGDDYKIVSLSPIMDDSQTVLVGLRRISTGSTFVHNNPRDLTLRAYRLPRQVVEPISKLVPPIYIKVIRLGDTTSIQLLSKQEVEHP
jgi:hypothetical protein